MPYGTHGTWRQFLRFALVGTTVALVYALGYNLLRWLTLGPALSSTLAYLLAITVQYIGHASFTFRKRARDGGQVLRFVLLNTLGLVVAVALTEGLTGPVAAPDWVASLAVVIVLPILNWFVMRLWVFA